MLNAAGEGERMHPHLLCPVKSQSYLGSKLNQVTFEASKWIPSRPKLRGDNYGGRLSGNYDGR